MLQTNSVFALACSPHILKAEVSIYDRRGLRMAQFDGLTGSWDGTSCGQPCQQGTYVYYIRYIDTADKGWKSLTGTVTLLR
jgi:gliding motility-associated-like protein